jgi:hypothetical protein
MTRTDPGYKDFWLKIFSCLAIAEVVDSIGREESFIQRAGSKYFYIDLLGGFVLALLIWEVTRFAILRLDRAYDWLERPISRISMQLLLGFLLPVMLSILLTYLYMKLLYDQEIGDTGWLNNELYTVICFILLINLIYFSWWIFLKWSAQMQTVQAPVESANLPAILPVSKAGKTILLPHHEIAYAFLDNGYCYIKPFTGDVFVTTYTLDELVKLFAGTNFFRVNRQMLINRRSCSTYEAAANGKIRLEICPAPKSEVTVSQKRASDFRKWIVI